LLGLLTRLLWLRLRLWLRLPLRLLALLVRHLVLEGSGSELILLHILHALSIHLHRLAWVRATLHLLLSMSRLLLLLMLLLLQSKLLSHDSLSLRVLLSLEVLAYNELCVRESLPLTGPILAALSW
jgi:hypothetical protein